MHPWKGNGSSVDSEPPLELLLQNPPTPPPPAVADLSDLEASEADDDEEEKPENFDSYVKDNFIVVSDDS